MLFTRNAELDRLRSRCNQDVPRLERLTGNLNGVLARESRATMERFDSLFRIATRIFCGDGVGEAALESDQLWPIEAYLTFRPLPFMRWT